MHTDVSVIIIQVRNKLLDGSMSILEIKQLMGSHRWLVQVDWIGIVQVFFTEVAEEGQGQEKGSLGSIQCHQQVRPFATWSLSPYETRRSYLKLAYLGFINVLIIIADQINACNNHGGTNAL